MTTTTKNGPYYKIKMCIYKEQCKYQEACQYAHSEQELRPFINGKQLEPIEFVYHTKMCKQGDFCEDSLCMFAHSQEELRQIPCKYQSFCRNWETCPYVHYFQEPHKKIDVHSLENTSLSCCLIKNLQNAETRLQETDCCLDKMESTIEQVFQNALDILSERELEIQALQKEYDELISKVEMEIKHLDKIISNKKKSRWDDSDDESEDNPITSSTTFKLGSSWAEDMDQED